MPVGRTPGHRAGMNRQTILDAALRIVDREGLKALSMRRLGAELGVEAMTIYHHVPNKDAVLDGLVELVVLQPALPDFGQLGWRAALRDYAHEFLETLLAHPQVIGLVATRPATTPANLRLMEDGLGAMREAGVELRHGLDIIYLLMGFVVSHAAALANTGHDDDQRDGSQLDVLSSLDPHRYPLLVEAAGSGSGSGSPQSQSRSRFDFAVEALLSGFVEVLNRRP